MESEKQNLISKLLIIGIGATALMDCGAFVRSQLGIKSLNMAYLGRWIGHMPSGQWFHFDIANTPSIPGELWIGWISHYLIGIAITAMLVSVYGIRWIRKPTLLPALLIALLTLVGPYLILQPALGGSAAASDFPISYLSLLKPLLSHAVFGFGLYFSAIAANWLFRFSNTEKRME